MEMHLPLVLFSYFLAVASGLFFAQGVLTIKGLSSTFSQYLSIIVTLVLTAIGGIAVFFHLQHWTRIFNGFGHLSSPITMEIIGIVVFVIVIAVYFLVFFRTEEGIAPKWTGWLAVVIGLLLMAVVGESYVLASTPVWASPLGILSLVLAVPAVAGPAMIILAIVSGKVKEFTFLGQTISGLAEEKVDEAIAFGKKLSLVGIILFVVSIVAYAIYIVTLGDSAFTDLGYYFDPTLPDIAMSDPAGYINLFTGELAPLFWIGVIALGCVAPIIVILISLKTTDIKKMLIYAIIVIVLVSVAVICFKIIFYLLGIHVFSVYTY